ncbi:L-fucose mutarotase/ribose pyranase (RbsD/FucU family) [Mesorhizobium sp. USDA 4775]
MQIEMIKNLQAPAAIYPLDIYVAHSLALMDVLEKRKLTPADLKRLSSDVQQLKASLDELNPPPAGWPG